MKKNVLVLGQNISQWYLDVLRESFGKNVYIDLITASEVEGNDVRIIKSPNYDKSSLKTRLLSWCKYYIFVKKWVKKCTEMNYLLVFGISNPPINSFLGMAIKKRWKVPFVYMIWDIYPEVIDRNLNSVFSKFVCKLWYRWNCLNYPKVDCILTIGNRMKSVIKRGAPECSARVIPLAADTKTLVPLNKNENKFVEANGLKNKFVVLYSGNMGIGHNIEIILRAAKCMEKVDDIIFVLIGQGEKYHMVESYMEERKPSNIALFPLQDEKMFPFSIACGNVGIVTQENKASDVMMPSRAFSMIACGMPIIGICSRKSDLSDLIINNKIGVVVDDDDETKISNAIIKLYKNNDLLIRLNTKSREVAENNYSMEKCASKHKKVFESIIYTRERNDLPAD